MRRVSVPGSQTNPPPPITLDRANHAAPHGRRWLRAALLTVAILLLVAFAPDVLFFAALAGAGSANRSNRHGAVRGKLSSSRGYRDA
jgi:hypothetical protein